MFKPKVLAVAFCWSLFFLLLAGACKPAGAAPPSLEEIVGGLQRTKSLVLEQSAGFHIVCSRKKSEQFAPYGSLLTAEWVLARKGDNWFRQQRFLNPYDDGNQQQRFLDSRGDGKKIAHPEPHVGVLKNGWRLNWTQYNGQCEVGSADMYNGWDYFQNLAIDVYPAMIKSAGESYAEVRANKRNDLNMDFPFLPEFLQANRAKYQIRPVQENVEGFPCWVVEWPGMDSMWIDAAHGFAVRHRRYHWGPGKPLRLDIVGKDFREAKAGLWLPYMQEVALYVDVRHQPEAIWGKLKNKSVFVVETIEFDNVPDDLFNVRLPAGTSVTDGIRGIQYRVSANDTDPFEGPIVEGTGLLGAKSRRQLLIVLANGLVVLIIAILIVRRRSRLARIAKEDAR